MPISKMKIKPGVVFFTSPLCSLPAVWIIGLGVILRGNPPACSVHLPHVPVMHLRCVVFVLFFFNWRLISFILLGTHLPRPQTPRSLCGYMINVDLITHTRQQQQDTRYRYLTVRTGLSQPPPPLCQCGFTRLCQINVAPVSVLGLGTRLGPWCAGGSMMPLKFQPAFVDSKPRRLGYFAHTELTLAVRWCCVT
jgi:hypothetical protein